MTRSVIEASSAQCALQCESLNCTFHANVGTRAPQCTIANEWYDWLHTRDQIFTWRLAFFTIFRTDAFPQVVIFRLSDVDNFTEMACFLSRTHSLKIMPLCWMLWCCELRGLSRAFRVCVLTFLADVPSLGGYFWAKHSTAPTTTFIQIYAYTPQQAQTQKRDEERKEEEARIDKTDKTSYILLEISSSSDLATCVHEKFHTRTLRCVYNIHLFCCYFSTLNFVNSLSPHPTQSTLTHKGIARVPRRILIRILHPKTVSNRVFSESTHHTRL